jgi:hypothetical protein
VVYADTTDVQSLAIRIDPTELYFEAAKCSCEEVISASHGHFGWVVSYQFFSAAVKRLSRTGHNSQFWSSRPRAMPRAS